MEFFTHRSPTFIARAAAVEEEFGADIDYALLIKLYGAAPNPEKHYPPRHPHRRRAAHVTGVIAAVAA